MSMYQNLNELTSDLSMIGSILEEKVEFHLIGTAAIALSTGDKDMVVGDIDTVTKIPTKLEWLGSFISDMASELMEKTQDVLNVEKSFIFGNLTVTIPSLEILIAEKLKRGEGKDVVFLEEYNLI